MISIRKQIIGIILLSVMAIAVAQGVIQFNSARAMLYDELNREYKMAVDDKAEKMNQTIKSIQFSVDQLSAVMLQMLDDAEKFKTDKSYQESYQNEVQPIVTKFAQGTFGAMTYYVRFNPEYSPGTSGLFYTDMDGNGSFEKQEPTDFSKYKPDDLEHVGWYYIPINNKKATWLDPYFNANINANMISYIVPLYKDGVTIGIVGMDINFDKFKSIMNEKKDISSNYFFLLSADNKFLIHSKYKITDSLDKLDNGKYVEISDQIKKQSEGSSKLTFDGQERVFVYSRMINGWTVVAAPDKGSIFGDIYSLLQMSIVIAALGLVVCFFIAFIFSTFLVKAVLKIRNFAENLANYDFSNSIEAKRRDEIGQTIRALNRAQDNIREHVRQIIDNTQSIAASSEELSATVEEISVRTVKIDKAAKDIAVDAKETSRSSETISAAMQDVDTNFDVLAEKASQGSSNANESKLRATEVQNKSKNSIEETRKLYGEKKEKALKAIEEGKVVENIKEMADTIANISRQINILSLNASIEAARAGEHGRGFAVVADEVRRLAMQTAQAVSSIQETIVQVQQVFSNLSENSRDILQFIHKGVDPQFELMAEMGSQYYNDAQFVATMSEEIAAMSGKLSDTIGQVNDSVRSNAEVAQKSSENAETIKLGIDETAKAIEQVAQTAQNQADLAQNLNEMIQKFKI